MTNRELAERLQGAFEGAERRATALVSRDAPVPGGVAVVFDAAALRETGAGVDQLAALVVPAELEGAVPCPVIRVRDPRLALARLSVIFDRRPRPAPGIHPSAVLASDAELAEEVVVGALAVIGAGVRIGRGSTVGAGCVIGVGAHLGEACRLHANVTLYDGVRLGDRVELHSGAVIGADGFGYAADRGGAHKIHHLGGVVIGDDVEIGACTTVDRGTLGDTVIGARSKIDNHCQVAHNVHIGSDCFIAGTTALAGSVRVGDRVTMGGGVVVADHVTIGDGVRLAGHTGVSKDIPAGETWAGYVGLPYRRYVRQRYLLGRLERIWRFVKERS